MPPLIPLLRIGSSWRNQFSVTDGIFAASILTANTEAQFTELTCREFQSQRIYRTMLMSKNGNMPENHEKN